MQKIIFCLAALLLLSVVNAQTTLSLKNEFESWKSLFNKLYSSPEEELYRLSVFVDNYNIVKKHNSNPKATYKRGLNQFSDITQEEFEKKFLMQGRPKLSAAEKLRRDLLKSSKKSQKITLTAANAAEEIYVNWDTRGIISNVRNQGQCGGGGYAFATVAHLESIKALQQSSHELYSEQQLIDCIKTDLTDGCTKGTAYDALNYVKNNSLADRYTYPYTGVKGDCNAEGGSSFIIDDFESIGLGDCEPIVLALQKKTVIVGVDAKQWKDYAGGLFDQCGDDINHYALLVGEYFNPNRQGYWYLKNSYGRNWGEEGYIRLTNDDTCGICEDAWAGKF